MFKSLFVTIIALLGFARMGEIGEEQFCVVKFDKSAHCINLNFEENLDPILNVSESLTIHQAIGSITKKNLGNLTKLFKFELSHSRIPDIESGALCTSFPNVVEMVLSDNKIFPKITQDLFLHCENIEKLEISRQILENGAFLSMPNLNELQLTNITFPLGLNKDSFKGLKSLASLKLSSNSLVKISDDTFDHIKGLARLTLANNRIVRFTTKKAPFRDLRQLNRLIFAGVPLGNFTWREFEGLNLNLFDLELYDESCGDFDTDTFLQNIPKATSHLKSLYMNECFKSAEITERLDERGVQVVWVESFVSL